jgi:tRNA G18 (ribose-2'-O)-methylase SpoU
MARDRVGRQLEGWELDQRQRQARDTVIPGPRVLAVDVRTPENVGHILRVSEAAGCADVLVVPHAPFSMKVVRRTARECDRTVRWRLASLHDATAQAAAWGDPLVALELTTGSSSLHDTRLPRACTVVLGGERAGIPPSVLEACALAVHIPMFGLNGSMNITHALAVALFEWRRQHPSPPP